MTDREKILDRIKKLLALAANNPSEHEASAAAAAAQRMMDRYNVEHADLIAAELTGGDGIIEIELTHTENEEFDTWVLVYAHAITICFDCYGLVMKVSKRTHVVIEDDDDFKIEGAGGTSSENTHSFLVMAKSFLLAGYGVDVEAGKSMFDFLHDTTLRMAESAYNFLSDPANEASMSVQQLKEMDIIRAQSFSDEQEGRELFMRSYAEGMANRLQERMIELFVSRDDVKTTSGQALAPLKKAKIKEKYDDLQGTTYTPKEDRRRYSAVIARRGREDAELVELQKKLGA